LIWRKKKSEVCGCERKKTKKAIEVEEEEHVFSPSFFSFLRQLTAEVFLGVNCRGGFSSFTCVFQPYKMCEQQFSFIFDIITHHERYTNKKQWSSL